MDLSNSTGAPSWDPDITAQQFGDICETIRENNLDGLLLLTNLLSQVGVIRAVWLGFLKSHIIYA